MSIDIPRIVIVPTGDVTCGYKDFDLDTSSINQKPVPNDILIQTLRQNQQFRLRSSPRRPRSGWRITSSRGLIDYDDISYDDHASCSTS